MAAGIIQGTVTTTSGETIEMSWLVDDTIAPTKWYNATNLVNSAGASSAFGTGAMGSTVPRVTIATDDPTIAILDATSDSASATTTIKGALRQIATATGSTAITRNTGASDSGTVRVTVDTDQLTSTVTSDQASNAAGQVVRIPPQEIHVGEFGGNTTVKTITMTADTSIMAAADIIADTQQLDGAFRKVDGTGVLQSMTVFDPDDNTAFAFDVYIHGTSTSMGSENGAISISDANAAAGIIGVISFATTDVKDLINGKMYHKSNLGLPVYAVSGTDDLYFSVVNGSGTPTFGGGSIPIRVGILRD